MRDCEQSKLVSTAWHSLPVLSADRHLPRQQPSVEGEPSVTLHLLQPVDS